MLTLLGFSPDQLEKLTLSQTKHIPDLNSEDGLFTPFEESLFQQANDTFEMVASFYRKLQASSNVEDLGPTRS